MKKGIRVTTPELEARDKMQEIHSELMHGRVTTESKDYFARLIDSCKGMDPPKLILLLIAVKG